VLSKSPNLLWNLKIDYIAAKYYSGHVLKM